jgi:hypothetical protein
MLNLFQGPRPSLTPAQLAGALVAAVPGLATLLTGFGVADVDAAQQHALTTSLTWAAVVAGLLIGSDAVLRSARNLADAKTNAAAMSAGVSSPLAGEDDLVDAEADFEEQDGPDVSDDEEFYADSELSRLEAGVTADDPDMVSR